MKNVRVWFRKAGMAQYISHLDLTRCMARGLKLSGLPVWYTEGFNPRIYMNFAMPLSLGVSGEREFMDIRLTEEVDLAQAACRLDQCLPQDISILEIALPEVGFEEIAFAEYEMRMETDAPQLLEEGLERIFAREKIIVSKFSKKGNREVDIKPLFFHVEKSRQPGALVLRLLLSCSQQGSVNPNLLVEALKIYENQEPYTKVCRKRIQKKDFSDMR